MPAEVIRHVNYVSRDEKAHPGIAFLDRAYNIFISKMTRTTSPGTLKTPIMMMTMQMNTIMMIITMIIMMNNNIITRMIITIMMALCRMKITHRLQERNQIITISTILIPTMILIISPTIINNFDDHDQNNDVTPIHGTGQGSCSSPSIWLMISSILIQNHYPTLDRRFCRWYLIALEYYHIGRWLGYSLAY